MVIRAEMRQKIAVSIVAVGVSITLIVGIDATYNQSELVSIGGLAFVDTIMAFVFVMASIGVWLSCSS